MIDHEDSSSDEQLDFWIPYSDLLVTLLMTFALLFFATLSEKEGIAERTADLVDSNLRAITTIAGDFKHGSNAMTVDSATGTIILPSSVLFEYDRSDVRPRAAAFLRDTVTAVLVRVISTPAIDSTLEDIVIEGHTDPEGDYMYNLRLSQARAEAVAATILVALEGHPKSDAIRSRIVASGRSESQPIYEGGVVNDSLSRRIAIRFRSRTDRLLRSILNEFRPADQ